MAIVVMMIIIVLNITLLVIMMRVGTQGEHYSELSAEQSTAVMTLQARLSKSLPAPVAKSNTDVVESNTDVADTQAEEVDSSASETDSE